MIRITYNPFPITPLVIFVLFCFAGCRDESADNRIVSFKLEAALNPGLLKDIEFEVGETQIIGMVPGDLTNLIATFRMNGVRAQVGTEVQVSAVTPNDFTNPVVYVIIAEDGTAKQYSVVATPRRYSSDKEVTAFVITAADNPCLTTDVAAFVGDTHITVFLPTDCNDGTISAVIESTGVGVQVNDKAEEDNNVPINYQESVTTTIVAEDGSLKSYSVHFYKNSDLPILNISTRDYAAVVSRDEYLTATLSIDDAQHSYRGEIEIKGRGNSTWAFPKKPYRIKLKDKAEILGMPADRDWVLLANYSDKTLLRNRIAFELSKRVGVPFTPKNQFVEVVLNGEYMGNYLLTEQVEVEDARVNINELAPTDITTDRITGGYLVEVDQRLDDTHCWRTNGGVPYCIKSPGDVATDQLVYIQNYLQQFENALFSPTFADPQIGYAKYIDTESFVNWYIVNELLKNPDGLFYSSVFMFKDRGGKLNMGPVWDFDISQGNVNYVDNAPQNWWIRNAAYINRLFADPAFAGQVDTRWDELRDNEIGSLLNFVDQEAAHIAISQENNFRRWDILDVQVWPNPVAHGSYPAEVEHLKSWLEQRLSWIDGQ
jgi:spore coat protein CotH